MITRLIFSLYDEPAGPHIHPQKRVSEWAKTNLVNILDAVPQSMAEQWWFWTDTPITKNELPTWLRIGTPLAVGCTGNPACTLTKCICRTR